MKLQFVEMTGFRGFRESVRFDFPEGFTVLSGRNGTGKSTVLDAIDYALTGTINKFSVREAKGGGLDDHIWWIGSERPQSYSVAVGFIDDDQKSFVVTRTPAGADVDASEIARRLSKNGNTARTSVETLLSTTLIRDELIASLSLDLPEQTRFSLVRDAIGHLVGPDYSERAATIVTAANSAKSRQEGRVKELQTELGSLLGQLTEARSATERAVDISEALRFIESQNISLPMDMAERLVALRRIVADRKTAMAEIERARALARQLLPELVYLNSPQAKTELQSATDATEKANREQAEANEKLATALRLDQAERESDEFAAHLSALLEHGTALGLQNDHCPLCNAVRTPKEFEDALASAKLRLASRGERLATLAASVADARRAASEAVEGATAAQTRLKQLEDRNAAAERNRAGIAATYARLNLQASPDDPASAEKALFAEQDIVVRLERALSVLESSSAVDRIKALESRIASLREQIERESARLTTAERAAESARQIENAARTVANQILTEHFDTVMPLLKELYRRLRPHADWTEIESNFGGKVRGSLNFVVGDGYNPQFLFSSGQRRAAGLAFLLAVHLSRPWCRWRTLLLDDPVQHIDDYRALNLVEVLAAIRRTNRQVIVAVEDPALADLLCRRLRSSAGETGRVFQLHTSKTGAAEILSARDIYPMPRLVLRSA